MKLTTQRLKKLIREELFYREFYGDRGNQNHEESLSESCADVEGDGETCAACAQDHPCPCAEEMPSEDFSDLDTTNITPEEAFSAGNIACEDEVGTIEDSWEFMRFAGPHAHGCHSCGEIHAHDVPDMKSYVMVGDTMVAKPETARRLIEPLMKETGAACPASAAQALADVLMLVLGRAQ